MGWRASTSVEGMLEFETIQLESQTRKDKDRAALFFVHEAEELTRRDDATERLTGIHVLLHGINEL